MSQSLVVVAVCRLVGLGAASGCGFVMLGGSSGQRLSLPVWRCWIAPVPSGRALWLVAGGARVMLRHWWVAACRSYGRRLLPGPQRVGP